MPRINQLSHSVINRIAAGEVIERPASVVKELLENSVDALSTRIEVDVVDGGAELIRITDDGEGIHPDDLLLAVTSHATSKLKEADDLTHVQTMGFRGEALASIAEVSHFRLRSRQADNPAGMELEVNGGVMVPPRECGSPLGTTIEVKQLFFNTPVRRKFMRSSGTELGHICEQFTRIALANPRLHLVLRHNQKVVYELPATDKLQDRLRLFYGSQLAEQLIWVEAEVGKNRVWGYVAHPSQSKATRKGEYLFLNGRWIQDRSLQHALTEAYRGLLMVGRYPITFLFLEMPAEEVDVNVHPTKSEVRFQDSQALFRLLLSTLRTKFLSINLDSQIKVPTAAPKETRAEPQPEPQRPLALSAELAAWADNTIGHNTNGHSVTAHSVSAHSAIGHSAIGNTAASASISAGRATAANPLLIGANAPFKPFPDGNPQPVARSSSTEWQPNQPLASSSHINQSVAGQPPAVSRTALDLPSVAESTALQTGNEFEAVAGHGSSTFTDESPVPLAAYSGTANGSATDALKASVTEMHPPAAGTLTEHAIPESEQPTLPPPLRAMQVHDCYLVVESADGLLVIDQHALHERIMYEHLRERVLAGHVESQRLLLPEAIDLSPSEAAILLENAETLSQIGLEISDFGGHTILLSRYPVMLGKLNLSQLVKDIAQQLCDSGLVPTRRDILDELLHMMSCKAAIKAGQRLTSEEIESLLTQRHLIDDAHHCPHGRPTSLTLSRTELDRQFGRLG